MDADLYSSTKCILNNLKDYIDKDCIIVFDELVNYPGFDGNTGELKAFYEFITENKVDYEWIGMNGKPTGMSCVSLRYSKPILIVSAAPLVSLSRHKNLKLILGYFLIKKSSKLYSLYSIL